MISKYLAPALAATVLLAGLTATPAQALTGASATPSPTPTSAISSAPTQTPTAAAAPKAPQASTATESTVPAASASPRATQSPSPEKPSAPVLKASVAAGDLSGKTLNVSKRTGKKLMGTLIGGSVVQGRYFEIQSYGGSPASWKILTNGYSTPTGEWSAYLSSSTDDKQVLRFVVPESDGVYAAYTGPSTTVNRTKEKFAVSTDQNPSVIHSVPWEQKEFKIWTSIYTDKLTAQLERYDGKKWAKVSSLVTNKSQYQYSFKLPKGTTKSKDGTVKYRVTIPASTYYETVTSQTINVRWENPNFYKGTQKTAYGYTAKQCPAVLVRMDAGLNKQGRWGQASLSYKEVKYYKLYTKIPAKYLKTVALHECSHFYQFATAINANNKGWDAYKAAANKLMGTKGDLGMERVNECMSATWGGHNYWTYGATAKLCAKPAVKSFVQKSLKGQKVT